MRLKRAHALAPLLALLALASALPVHADTSTTVTIAPRWGTATPGSWNAYEVVVQNAGNSDFQGTVVLFPANAPYQQGGYNPQDQYPHYSKQVTVTHQSEQKVEIMVYDAPFGYSVQVNDANGNKVAEASLPASQQQGYTVGVLSDVRGANLAIQGNSSFNYKVTATQFNGATDFPKSALELTGLQTLVIDSFDSGSLSQTQLHAIRDFVGLGGDLVLGGGTSWRRTLLPLPQEIVPLRPTQTQDESLQPLADMAGQTTNHTAAVVSGTPAGTPVVVAQDGAPLVIESTFGAGRVVLLTYDPLADPFATDTLLGALGWGQGLTRSLGNAALNQSFVGKGGGGPVQITNGGVPVTGHAPGVIISNSSAVGPSQPYADIFASLLVQAPGATAPPLALLGLILLAYVLLTGPIAYLVLRAIKRRELLWATLPAGALVFTIASYAIGLGAHGGDFIDTSVEVQRVTPSGAMQVTSYHAVYAPARGDHTVSLPADTIATTAFGSYGGGGGLSGRQTSSDTVVVGGHPQILLHGVNVFEPNNFQTLSIVQGSTGVEAELSYSQGTVHGTIRNRTTSVLRDIRLTASGYSETKIAPSLQPGESVGVQAGFTAAVTPGSPNYYYNQGCVNGNTQSGREDCVLMQAANWGGSLPGAVTLVGLVGPVVPITVDGATPHRTSIAVFAEPVMLKSSDSFVAGIGSARLVSIYRSTTYLDAYDINLPASSTYSAYALKYTANYAYATGGGAGAPPPIACAPPNCGQPGAASPSIYNWTTGKWRKLPTTTGATAGLAPLTADETSHGIVRVQITEFSPGQYSQFFSVLPGTGR